MASAIRVTVKDSGGNTLVFTLTDEGSQHFTSVTGDGVGMPFSSPTFIDAIRALKAFLNGNGLQAIEIEEEVEP